MATPLATSGHRMFGGRSWSLHSGSRMNRRTKSIFVATCAGASVGLAALGIGYAPWPVFSASNRGAGALASPVDTFPEMANSLESADMPRVAAPRIDPLADPSERVACAEDMALVQGDACPALAYACLKPSDEIGYRCAEYARGLRCVGETEPRRYCIDRHEWPNRIGENPLVYVDWHEAKALCQGAGKRLCRRSEWMLACEGPKRLPYPWGYARQPSPCNIDRASIPFDIPAMLDDETRESELARLWQADRIGTHPDCVSAYGVYDMAGNVDEWTDDEADDPHTKHPSTLNGGYWGPVRDTCRLTTTSHGPTFKFYQVGFRCCSDTIDGAAL